MSNNICFVNGSPRGQNSNSSRVITQISEMLDKSKCEIYNICIADSLKSKNTQQAFTQMAASDSIIFVFPLYIDAIPSNMLDFLWLFDEYVSDSGKAAAQKTPRVYCVINNGFIEGSQNINAAQIMKHFSSKMGFTWRFAVGIGAGEFINATSDSIPLKSRMKREIYAALDKLASDVNHNDVAIQKDVFVSPAMPKWMFMLTSNMFWTSTAKKSRKVLSQRPV